MEEGKQNFVKIDLVGINEQLFTNLRTKLVTMINDTLESSIDKPTGVAIKREIDKFTSFGLNGAPSKANKISFGNYQLVSEIKDKYSEIEKRKAETRKINAEANSLEFEQRLKNLTLTLKMTKTLLIGQQGDEAIAFTKQLDSFLEVIESLKESNEVN